MGKNDNSESRDLIMLHGPTDDGEGVLATRARPGRLDAAELRPVREGLDVSHSEVVRLIPHDDAPFVCDVDVLYSPEKGEENQTADNRSGPPRVSTNDYRKNWEQVFGAGKTKNHLMN